MKFKSKPVKVTATEPDCTSTSGSDLDISEAMRSLSPLPHASIQVMEDSDLEQNNNPLTKLPSPSPIRSADEDSGVGGSPGSSTRPTSSHNCHMCNKKFSRADILKKHVKTHASSSCTVCGQLFNDKVALAKHHVEVHSSSLDRVYQCSQCEKGFKEMRTLRLHLKIHNAEYPEQCGVCQKVFRTKWQLKQHQMDHGGERPYPCPECSFTCKTKQQLNEHRRKHSGEKAYSCAQCGTRFTYRNGLIKHTKLNRCPKKIITPEGETIIKKRSRSFTANNKAKELARQDSSSMAAAASPSTSYGHTSSPHIQQPLSSANDQSVETQQQQQQQQQPVNATLFVQNNQIQLHANGGTYGLALLEDGSLIATPTSNPATTHYEQKLGTSSLSPNVIAALSAATGLSPQEISSWAANLPAGSTVKVTHHYNESSLPNVMTADKPAPCNSSSTRAPPLDHVLRQQRQQLNEMATTCHDSLISACVGLPSYQESFAVDPNEILSKDRSNKFHIKQEPLPAMANIKQEPVMASDDLNNNDHTSPRMINTPLHDPYASFFSSDPPRPSVINMANSRLLNMENSTSTSVKQEPGAHERLVQNNNYNNLTGFLSDIDLDEFPDNIVDDMDISGFNLNDQDFTSIKSIVEQTFKDGRDVLDIISAV